MKDATQDFLFFVIYVHPTRDKERYKYVRSVLDKYITSGRPIYITGDVNLSVRANPELKVDVLLNGEHAININCPYINELLKRLSPSMIYKTPAESLTEGQKNIEAAFTPPIRAICDSGAQMNLITFDCVERNNLFIYPTAVQATAAGQQASMKVYGKIVGNIFTREQRNTRVEAQFVVVDHISGMVPDRSMKHIWPEESDKHLADPTWAEPGPVEALLVAGVFARMSRNHCSYPMQDQYYIAQNTDLGYVISGYETKIKTWPWRQANIITNEELNENLIRNWEIQEPSGDIQMSQEDKYCEEQFEKTHARDESGRYAVHIPINEVKLMAVGDTKVQARKLFSHLERRMQKTPEIWAKYVNFIEDYIADGHMQLAVKTPQKYNMEVFIPHHALGEDKKFRVVFNASHPSDTGLSINEAQFKGPRLQDDLEIQIIRFRMRKIGIGADVAKMFRMVAVHPSYWDMQKIYWRKTPDEPIQEYQITRVPYGCTYAAYVSVKAMQQCAKDHANEFPLASKAMLNNFYMDDFWASLDTVAEAREMRQQLEQCTAKGGFTLAKWASNHKDVLDNTEIASTRGINDDRTASVLGLQWNTDRDTLRFKMKNIDETNDQKLTKRIISSMAAKLYDPNGYATPLLLEAKVLMQDLWRAGHDWDHVLDQEIAARWH